MDCVIRSLVSVLLILPAGWAHAQTEDTGEPFEEVRATPVPDDPPIEEAAAEETVPADASLKAQQLVRYGSSTDKPYRGSKMVLRNTFSPISLLKDAELTYNPYYATVLRLFPRWWFNESFYVAGWLDITAQLTQTDWTPDRFYINDFQIMGGWANFYRIPVVDIDLSAELALAFGTSRASQGESLALSTGIDLNLNRVFDVLDGLSLDLDLEISKNWHRYTTGSPGGKLQPPCPLGVVDCLALPSSARPQDLATVGGGVRNVSWSTSFWLSATLMINDWLWASLRGVAIRGQLYGLDEWLDGHDGVPDPQNARYQLMTQMGVVFFPGSVVSASLGAVTLADQLRPDGTYRAPFFNRATQIYVDVAVSIDRAVDLLE